VADKRVGRRERLNVFDMGEENVIASSQAFP